MSSLTQNVCFLGLLILAGMALMVNLLVVVNHDEIVGYLEDPSALLHLKTGDITHKVSTNIIHKLADSVRVGLVGGRAMHPDNGREGDPAQSHLYPPLPYLPAFAEIPDSEKLIQDTLNGSPTMAGVAAILNRFIQALHDSNTVMNAKKAEVDELIQAYFSLAQKYLVPFDDAYRGKPIFPIRDDESVFISLAAFREHLLAQTLRSAFTQASNPHRLYIGAVVQNCFGIERVCKTGHVVVGKNDKGKDMTKVSDAPPDKNGIEEFCTDDEFKQYCESGQVRAIYVNETDSLGPAAARYYASKLWGGETYFMQMDSHLEFAPSWDQKYIDEVRAAKSFPKAVLSAYPPGFQNFGEYKGGSKGTRLCTCQFSSNAIEDSIIRINTGTSYRGDEPRPTQIAFIAAGFFFAQAEFLVDVPFDPFLPWCFMGEEILLSMRAWTAGWDIYAPRENLIAHQYRPVSGFYFDLDIRLAVRN